MPTVTIQVGQAGNQLGYAWWSLLRRQQKQLGDGLLTREYFRPSESSREASDPGSFDVPRVMSVDSEAKVINDCFHCLAQHQSQFLGHGGCGNNWACGYQLGVSSIKSNAPSWSSSIEAPSKMDQVMEGIRKECEAIAGVPDFLLMASLAGGTGSGTGSAILECVADEYPASTVAAVAVAPGHTGFLLLVSLAGGTGSGTRSAILECVADGYPASTIAAVAVAPGHTGDSTVQSINSCLALQHLDTYAHAVTLIDNQTLLNQLNTQLSSSNSINSSSSSSGCSSNPGGSKTDRSTSRTVVRPISLHRPNSRVTAAVPRVPSAAARSTTSASQPAAATGAGAAASDRSVTGRACLAGVNQLVAESLVGLLWPADELDLLARRSNIRILASTICADPLTKFIEVCHVARPVSPWTSNTSASDTWAPRIKLLSSQLPRYNPYEPTQAVTTSAAVVITRDMPGTAATTQHSSSSILTHGGSSSSWFSPAYYGGNAFNMFNSSGSGSNCWQQDLCRAVCRSWPYFIGGMTDVHTGYSPVAIWSTGQQGVPSMTAAVCRSSTGSFMRAAAQRALQLCDAGAYMHWYEQYGCEPQMIREAAYAVTDMAEAYHR